MSPSDTKPQPINLKASAILDIDDEQIQRLVATLREPCDSDRAFVQKAHRHLCRILWAPFSARCAGGCSNWYLAGGEVREKRSHRRLKLSQSLPGRQKGVPGIRVCVARQPRSRGLMVQGQPFDGWHPDCPST